MRLSKAGGAVFQNLKQAEASYQNKLGIFQNFNEVEAANKGRGAIISLAKEERYFLFSKAEAVLKLNQAEATQQRYWAVFCLQPFVGQQSQRCSF